MRVSETAAISSLVVMTLGTPGIAGLILYEGNTFPEELDPQWTRTVFCTPERWIEAGWLIQRVQFEDCTGEGGEYDRYVRPLSSFVGHPHLFCEWYVWTDGPSTEVIGVAPASLVVANALGAVDYHFTVSSDLVRLIRDDDLPYVFVGLDPTVPHHYRLEIDNNLLTYA